LALHIRDESSDILTGNDLGETVSVLTLGHTPSHMHSKQVAAVGQEHATISFLRRKGVLEMLVGFQRHVIDWKFPIIRWTFQDSTIR
jgi:hypothetical protein